MNVSEPVSAHSCVRLQGLSPCGPAFPRLGEGAAPWAVGTEGFPPALCPSGLSVDAMLIFLAEGLCPQEPGRPPDALFTFRPQRGCDARLSGRGTLSSGARPASRRPLHDSASLCSLHSSASEICCYCCSVTQSYLTLFDPMERSAPGFPVLHHLQELAQIHVH